MFSQFKLFTMFILLGCTSFAGTGQNIATAPNLKQLSLPGHFNQLATTFVALTDGTYAISLVFSFGQEGRFRQEYTQSATYHLEKGHLVRDERALYYVNGTEKVHVATKKFWAYPTWQLEKGIQISPGIHRLPINAWETYVANPTLIIRTAP